MSRKGVYLLLSIGNLIALFFSRNPLIPIAFNMGTGFGLLCHWLFNKADKE